MPALLGTQSADEADGCGSLRVVTVIDLTRQRQAYEEISKLTDTILDQALKLKHANQDLEQRVAERTAELHTANVEAIYMLAVASEARDRDTHVQRIQRYTRAMGRQLTMADDEVETLGCSSVLHDVGKIHIPDHILLKPGPLDDDERSHMQRHTVVGEAILSKQPFFQTARSIARSHHENWDGSGYPDGKAGHAIPLPARIVHIVDVFDALTTRRVYKPAWSHAHSVQAVRDQAGRQFDPELVAAFDGLAADGTLEAIRTELPDCIDDDAGDDGP
jgi:HD-GYP domain-containing protein (c-di-GMP phosphodiesterase class II)